MLPTPLARLAAHLHKVRASCAECRRPLPDNERSAYCSDQCAEDHLFRTAL